MNKQFFWKSFVALTLGLLMTGHADVMAQSITNPSFEDGTTGWTVSKMQIQGNDGMGNYKAGNNYIERWISSGNLLGYASVKQTVTGLSNGVYRLSVAAMNISQNNTNAAQVGAWIVGNGLRTAVTTLGTYTLDFFVTDGTAEIGFVCDGASGNWVGCDNFTLTYRGNTNTYIQSAGNTVKNYANNLISTYGSDSQYSSLVSTLTSAISGGNLTNVANAAKAVVAGERAYRLRHPSGSAPTVTWNKRHARGAIWIFGRVSWTGSNVVEEGFCYSTSPNPTLENASYATDWIDSYGKVIWIQGLTPGTMYYIRPYAMTKGGAVGYGDVLKVPTIPQGDIHWSVRDSGDSGADNHIRSSCEWAFDQWWDNLTQLTSFYPSIGHVSGVPTAECSRGGWCSCGDSWDYQKTGTILHEMLHGVSVGTHWMWGDFTRDQYPVWDALRFWNNDENATLSGDGMHLWPYGINGAHEDSGTDQLYIGNSLVCEALGEGGLPLTDGQWLLPYYAFVQDDNTKYYIKCEDKNRGLTTSFLVSDNSGNLKWQEMSATQAQNNDKAAWYITFDASNQKYHIKNVSTNKYIRYESANANNGFTTGNTATDIQMKKCRVDVNVGSQTYHGLYFLDYGSGQSMVANTGEYVGSTGFSIWDDATTQRWIILAAGSDVEAFESGAVEIQLDELRRYLNGYTACKNVNHTDKTSGATTALTNTINTINSAISGTVTMDQVLQYIEDIKSAGLTFLNNTKPADGVYYDLTFLIKNADFTNGTEGWSLSPTLNYGAIEFYQTTFDFYQTLPDMPAGTYLFSVDAFQRPGGNEAVYNAYQGGTDNVNAVIYVNSTSQKIKNVMSGQQNSSISNGEYTTAGNTYVPNNMESGSTYLTRNKYNNQLQSDFAAGNMRIGLRGTVSNDGYWTMADNFKLYYMGANGVIVSLKDQLQQNGFTKLTALPQDYSPYFFVLYDHDQDLTMVLKNPNHQGGSKSMWYDADVNPMTSKEPLWTMDSFTQDNTEYQVLANATYSDYMLQTEGNDAAWNYRCSDNGGNGNMAWGRTLYEYDTTSQYWTIQSGVYPQWGYLGAWSGSIGDDQETALNKTDNAVGHFDVFTILRGDYVNRFDAWSDATYESPLDITYVLENPGGERRTAVGWKSTGAGWWAQGGDNTGKVGSYYLESWNGSGIGNSDLYQEISGLPDGYYRFSAKGFVRDGGDQGFSIYANSESTKVTGSDLNTRFYVIVQVLDGNLKVGAKAENVTKDWIGIDDAKLEYLGTSIPGYNVGTPTSDIVDGSVYTKEQAFDTWTLVFSEANSNVPGAVFAKLDDNKKVSLYKGNTKVGDYMIYISGTTVSVNFNGVELDPETSYTLTLPAGVVGYAGQVSNEAFSVTFTTPYFFTGTYYLYNPKTDDFLDWDTDDAQVHTTFLGTPITWTNGSNGATIKFTNNKFLGGQYWSVNDANAGINWEAISYGDGFKIHRTQPEDASWEYLYVGDNQRVASNGKCRADNDGDGNFDSWDYGTWQFMTQEEYDAYVKILNETGETAPAAAADVKVLLKRSIIADDKWNTICFPFALTSTQIENVFGEGTVVKELTGATANGENAVLTFGTVNDIAANTPYILKTEQANSEFQLRGITITPNGNLMVEKGGIQFIGNYVNPKVLSNTDGTDYYIKDNMFYSSPGSTKLKGYRAYFHVPSTTSGIKSLNANFDGEATAIEGIEQLVDWDNAEVYDLSGRRVRRPSKGFYIVNGQKVFIK